MKGGIREDCLKLSVLTQGLQVVSVPLDPIDFCLVRVGYRGGGDEVLARFREKIGGSVEPDDAAAGKNSGEKRVDSEVARAAAQIEDALLRTTCLSASRLYYIRGERVHSRPVAERGG